MCSSNPKVKREATGLVATLFKQLGPQLKALCMSLATKQDAKNALEKAFSENEYDPSSLPAEWPMRSIVVVSEGAAGGAGSDRLTLEIPKTDLFSLLPPDILTKMVSANRLSTVSAVSVFPT